MGAAAILTITLGGIAALPAVGEESAPLPAAATTPADGADPSPDLDVAPGEAADQAPGAPQDATSSESGGPEDGQDSSEASAEPPALTEDAAANAAPDATADDGPDIALEDSPVSEDGLFRVTASVAGEISVAAVAASATPTGQVRTLSLDNVTVVSGAGGATVAVETPDPATAIREMEASGLYRAVGLVRQYPAAAMVPNPDDPYFTAYQYALRNLQGATTWTASSAVGARFQQAWPKVGGADTTAPIAVVDTAFPRTAVTDLGSIVGRYDWADLDSDVRLPASVTDSSAFHGAAVSSVIGATTNNGTQLAGAAQSTQVFFYKTLPDAGAKAGDYDMPNDAIAFAIRHAYLDGAKVVNLSLGDTCAAQQYWPLDPIYYAIQDVVAAGVTVVAAAGNGYSSALHCPAAYPGVIGVGATAVNGTKASFSQFNASVDIAAPGVDILVCDSACHFDAGTSFASPLVAAAAGLLKRTNPALTPAQIERVLTYTAQDAGAFGRDNSFGWGVLDASRALDYANNPNGVSNPLTTLVPKALQIVVSPDLNGDKRGDLLVVDSTQAVIGGNPAGHRNKLLFYPGTASGGIGASSYVGIGWGDMTIYAPGDWDLDGYADVLARDSVGQLFLYKGNGRGGLMSGRTQIGHGWSAYTVIPAGDLNGDKKIDLLAIHNTTGVLYLYRGNGKGGFYSGNTQVGHGWLTYNLYAAGDLNADGKNDILGISKTTGKLYRYFGKGSGAFQPAYQVGHGWTGFAMSSGASIDGDQYSDMVGVNPDGKLFFYKGKGGGGFYTAKQIASGF